MTGLQKQKQNPDDRADDKKAVIQDDPALKAAAEKGKDLLKRMDQATKKKSGRWVMCCGVRTFVFD